MIRSYWPIVGLSLLYIRAGKNLRFFKINFKFLGFLGLLGFNVHVYIGLRTVARSTLDTEIRSRRRPVISLHEDELMHCSGERYEITTPMNSNKFTEFDMKN